MAVFHVETTGNERFAREISWFLPIESLELEPPASATQSSHSPRMDLSKRRGKTLPAVHFDWFPA